MVSIRIASILLWCNGVGFGLPSLLTIRNLWTGRDLPIVMGFRAFGGGSFERAGTQTMIALLAVFFLVCILDCIAGWLLWSGLKSGAILSLILIPVGAIFWWGFALPFPPIFAVVRTCLIVINWRSLS